MEATLHPGRLKLARSGYPSFIMDDHALPLPIELRPDQAYELSFAAFREGDPGALEQAHRDLYSLYADKIWRNPNAPNRARLEYVRGILEDGFRHHLAARREEFGVHFDSPNLDEKRVCSRWLEIQALSPHVAETAGWEDFIRERCSLESMKRIVAQRSLFYLREPDPWIYAVPTLRGISKAGLIDLLLDEYGWGKLVRMHSSVSARLTEALGLESERDHYEAETSWQYLATLNHQWMCALDGALSRRLLGTIYLTEAGSPDAMRNYLTAWDRLGIHDPDVREFYELHIEADENHSEVALREVVIPVCELEGPETAIEVATGIFDARALEADFAASEIEFSSRVPV
jgi:hypothetical protein